MRGIAVQTEMWVESKGDEIEVTVKGVLAPAEPDVGLMTSYVDQYEVYDAAGKVVELTKSEEARVQQVLVDELELREVA